MSHKEDFTHLNIFQQDHIRHMQWVIYGLKLSHQNYAKAIYDKYEERKGHSWYGMKSLETLRQYNKNCLNEFVQLEKDMPGKAASAIVGSVRYEVAIPGISDVDGAVLLKKGTTTQERDNVKETVANICDSFGYENNVSVVVMDPAKYSWPQMLYDYVLKLGVQGETDITQHSNDIHFYLHQLASEFQAYPDVRGWDTQLEAYAEYFISKPKTPATYANRLINVIGQKKFDTVEDWKEYNEQIKTASTSRPFDDEEFAAVETFTTEGYLY